MNSRSSQVLLYTGDRGRTPSALSTSCGWSPPHPGFLGCEREKGWSTGWGRVGRVSGHRAKVTNSVLTKCAAPTEVFLPLTSSASNLLSKAVMLTAHPLLVASPTHSSRLRCSHPRHRRSPCRHHRASAQGRTHGCQDRRRKRGRKSCLLRMRSKETERDSGVYGVKRAAATTCRADVWIYVDSIGDRMSVSSGGTSQNLVQAAPHRSEPPHRSRPRNRHSRRTATAWRCNGGSGIQTGPLSRTCLE